jgi:hypothetical protein
MGICPTFRGMRIHTAVPTVLFRPRSRRLCAASLCTGEPGLQVSVHCIHHSHEKIERTSAQRTRHLPFYRFSFNALAVRVAVRAEYSRSLRLLHPTSCEIFLHRSDQRYRTPVRPLTAFCYLLPEWFSVMEAPSHR